MVSAIDAISQALRAGACSVLSGAEQGAQYVSNVYGTSFGAYNGAAGLRRQICSDNPANDDTYEPPFMGGQCDQAYVVFLQRIMADGSTPFSPFGRLTRGPILGTRRVPLDGGSPPNYSLQINTNGSLQAQSTCGAISASGQAWRPIGSGVGQDIKITSITPCGSDDCGNIPPVVAPPQNFNYDVDITYNIDDSTEITVPLSVIFAPVYVALDGKINAPISVDLGGIKFDGTVEFAPEFKVEIQPSGSSGGGGGPDDPGDLDDPSDPGEPVPPENPQTPPIVGVLVFSQVDSDAVPSGILFVDGPNLYVPRLASVQFAIKTGNSIAWTSDQDVKNTECYVPCIPPQGAIAVRVSPMPGVTVSFTPVRGVPLTEF
jgi:hypothetical protein